MKNKFESMGLMVDCSRNAVLNVESIKKLIDLMNIMGYDSLQLYTEDTYEVEGEPYFGYKRGKYSIKEIQEIDEYAKSKNVKLIPCIQTLAHLNAIFRWDTYNCVHDIDDILLIDEPKTYELIEHMFASLRKAYSSDVIHIGMDEAWQLGRGTYYNKHGDYNRFGILMNHLTKVVEIAKKYNFRPMIWGDMFIRDAKQSQDFDFDSAKERINKLADLVYWNYYSTDKKVYDNDIDFYHKLCDNTIFAGGLWCWSGFAPFNEYSIDASRAAINSCIEKGIKNVFFTMWGDNGAECSIFSLLPSMFYVSCLARGLDDVNKVREEFKKKLGLSYDAFMLLDTPNNLTEDRLAKANPCKYMLYNDPFLGIYDNTIMGNEVGLYKEYARKLHEASLNAKEYKYLFDYLSSLCDALVVKFDLGKKTREAYKKNDKMALTRLLNQYRIAIMKIKRFYDFFRICWEKENKPYGFEIQDIRIGGLITRLENCRRRIGLFIRNRVTNIPELDEEVLEHSIYSTGKPQNINHWDKTSSANIH